MSTQLHCDCGELTGVPCAATPETMTVVEFMPEHLRASQEAAGGSGRYPHNGAIRVAVTRSCAYSILDDDEWAVEVNGADPAEYAA